MPFEMKPPLLYAQAIKYTLVGVASNLILYIVYLLLTFWGLGPKLAMSMLFATGVLQTFFANRRWTFQHVGDSRLALIRYSLSYAFGYVMNLLVLIVCVDTLKWPHQAVQGGMIIILAAILFCLQKFWVYRTK